LDYDESKNTSLPDHARVEMLLELKDSLFYDSHGKYLRIKIFAV
jgi:hypothetical protein